MEEKFIKSFFSNLGIFQFVVQDLSKDMDSDYLLIQQQLLVLKQYE